MGHEACEPHTMRKISPKQTQLNQAHPNPATHPLVGLISGSLGLISRFKFTELKKGNSGKLECRKLNQTLCCLLRFSGGVGHRATAGVHFSYISMVVQRRPCHLLCLAGFPEVLGPTMCFGATGDVGRTFSRRSSGALVVSCRCLDFLELWEMGRRRLPGQAVRLGTTGDVAPRICPP